MKLNDFNFIDFKKVRKRLYIEKEKYSKQDWTEMRKSMNIKSQVETNIFGTTQKRPSLEYITKVAKMTNKPIDYFLYGEEIFLDIEKSNYIEIPVIKDHLDSEFKLIEIKMEKGCVYNYKWLNIITNNPRDLKCMSINNDVMEPSIHNGDCIIIDPIKKDLSDGGFFAFHFINSPYIIIRKIIFEPTKIELIPENNNYKTFIVKPGKIKIIGRVIMLKRLLIMLAENF